MPELLSSMKAPTEPPRARHWVANPSRLRKTLGSHASSRLPSICIRSQSSSTSWWRPKPGNVRPQYATAVPSFSPTRLGRGVDRREDRVALRGVGDREALVEELLQVEERLAGPRDEGSFKFLQKYKRRILGADLLDGLSAPTRVVLKRLAGHPLRQQRVCRSRRVEAAPALLAGLNHLVQLVEVVVVVNAARVGREDSAATAVEQRRPDGLLPRVLDGWLVERVLVEDNQVIVAAAPGELVVFQGPEVDATRLLRPHPCSWSARGG